MTTGGNGGPQPGGVSGTSMHQINSAPSGGGLLNGVGMSPGIGGTNSGVASNLIM